jgi:hypothetical protein
MIKSEKAAGEISALMLQVGAEINESIRMVMETCDEEDFTAYRRAAASVMTEILLEVLNPLYARHPTLKPPEMI